MVKQYLKIKPNTTSTELSVMLRWYWGMSIPGIVVSLEGGITEDDNVNPELKTIFGFALSKTVNSMNALLITNDNDDRGYITFVGEALKGNVEDITHESQIVGFTEWKRKSTTEDGVSIEFF